MYRQETLDAIVEQEQLYKFKTFDHTAAIELGSLIIENSKDLG